MCPIQIVARHFDNFYRKTGNARNSHKELEGALREISATIGVIVWLTLNLLLWYAHPPDLQWFLASLALGITAIVAFQWHVTRAK